MMSSLSHRLLLLIWFVLHLGASSGSDDQYGDDDAYSNPQVVDSCQNGVVQVSNIEVLCDSPYTFYYGNGAHRNSPYCDYGDKVTLVVDLEILEDLSPDITIYTMLWAYTGDYEEVFSSSNSRCTSSDSSGPSLSLCSDLIGNSSCYNAGSYQFQYRLQFAYIDGQQSQFVPLWSIAFSDQAGDAEGALGGVNLDNCNQHDMDYYIDLINGKTNTTLLHYRTANFASNYGILVGTLLVLLLCGVLLYRSTKKELEREEQQKRGYPEQQDEKKQRILADSTDGGWVIEDGPTAMVLDGNGDQKDSAKNSLFGFWG